MCRRGGSGGDGSESGDGGPLRGAPGAAIGAEQQLLAPPAGRAGWSSFPRPRPFHNAKDAAEGESLRRQSRARWVGEETGATTTSTAVSTSGGGTSVSGTGGRTVGFGGGLGSSRAGGAMSRMPSPGQGVVGGTVSGFGYFRG